MNIIIIGAGALGQGIAEYLERFDHEIALIEHDENIANAARSKLDAQVIVGSGSNPAILKRAQIENADMLIAVTPHDDVNLLACHFAMQYNVDKRIARIVSDEILKIGGIDLNTLGVTHVIETESEIVKVALSLVSLFGLTETADFHGGSVLLRGYRVTANMPLCGKNLIDVRKLASDADMIIVAIVREGKSIIPTGADELLVGDEFITVMPKDSYNAYCELIGYRETKIKKVIVAGDGSMAINLADALTEHANRVQLFDPDRTHAQKAATLLDKVEVFCGDATDANFLQETNAGTCDFFIAAGKDMEDNIMSCILAKAEGAKQTVALRNDDRHFEIFLSLGIDHVISPKFVTLQKIIESIHIAPIDSLLRIKRADLRIVRVKITKRSGVAGRSLMSFGKVFKKGIIVGAIIREETAIIPKGDTLIAENDELIVICYEQNIPFLNKLFRADLPI